MYKDVDLPKKPSETGVIRRMFLDPSASHLIITTTLGDNYYLHTQSRQPKPLSRLKGLLIDVAIVDATAPAYAAKAHQQGKCAADVEVFKIKKHQPVAYHNNLYFEPFVFEALGLPGSRVRPVILWLAVQHSDDVREQDTFAKRMFD